MYNQKHINFREPYAGGLRRFFTSPLQRLRSLLASAGAFSLRLAHFSSGDAWTGSCRLTGTPAMVEAQPPVLHACPSLPHKERALQFSGQSDGAEAKRGGGGHVLHFHSITPPPSS